jgi:hypothetical protein
MTDAELDRAVEQTAKRISEEMEKLVGELPDGAAPQMAMERLMTCLIERRPQLTLWMVEHFVNELIDDSFDRLANERKAARKRKTF